MRQIIKIYNLNIDVVFWQINSETREYAKDILGPVIYLWFLGCHGVLQMFGRQTFKFRNENFRLSSALKFWAIFKNVS